MRVLAVLHLAATLDHGCLGHQPTHSTRRASCACSRIAWACAWLRLRVLGGMAIPIYGLTAHLSQTARVPHPARLGIANVATPQVDKARTTDHTLRCTASRRSLPTVRSHYTRMLPTTARMHVCCRRLCNCSTLCKWRPLAVPLADGYGQPAASMCLAQT